MGFHLKLVITSKVDSETREAILKTAFDRWPFCRGPWNNWVDWDRAVFAPPELTDYLFNSDESIEIAYTQANQVEDGLTEFSTAFPDVSFAFLEANCFGGNCIYSGFGCKDGQRLPVPKGLPNGSLESLAGTVGIVVAGPFRPFMRGYFAYSGSSDNK